MTDTPVPFLIADTNLLPLLLAGLAAFVASILGGLAGYGTGLILPVFLAPLVGVANIVPVMAVAMLFNNAGRVAAFRRDIRWPQAGHLLLLGLPACLLGAWSYTLLSDRWVGLLIGAFLLVIVPARRRLKRLRLPSTSTALRGAGAVFGYVNGGMTGAGVLLIAMLTSAGLGGAALIATDAVVSLTLGLAKVAAFGGLARLDAGLLLAGVLVGLCTVPGGFVARRLLERIPAGIHAAVMDVVIVAGAIGLILHALG